MKPPKPVRDEKEIYLISNSCQQHVGHNVTNETNEMFCENFIQAYPVDEDFSSNVMINDNKSTDEVLYIIGNNASNPIIKHFPERADLIVSNVNI